MSFALLTPTRHDVYPFIDPRANLKDAAAGKTVLISGAGSGIGRGIAESFALAGAKSLILAARRTAPLEETKTMIAALVPGCEIHVLGGVDIADEASVDRLFADLKALPDVVVSNAAVSGATEKVIDSDPATWWRDVDINLRGTYLVARAYLRAVRVASNKPIDGGRLINVSSNASWRYVPGRSSYAASKIALNNLTEYLDREEQEAGGTGVRCVAMHPGGVDTEIAGMLPESIRKMLIDTPALPGGTAVFLSTRKAGFLMGRYVSSTWDMEELVKLEARITSEGDLLKSRIVGLA